MRVKPKLIRNGGRKLRIQHRQHIDYEYSASALKYDFDLFFTGMRRQTLHHAAKILSKKVGEEIVAISGEDNTGQKGYILTKRKELPQEEV